MICLIGCKHSADCLQMGHDIIIYRTVNSEKDANKLQRDLDVLHQWKSDWGMTFKSSKCYSEASAQPTMCTLSRAHNLKLKIRLLTWEWMSQMTWCHKWFVMNKICLNQMTWSGTNKSSKQLQMETEHRDSSRGISFLNLEWRRN